LKYLFFRIPLRSQLILSLGLCLSTTVYASPDSDLDNGLVLHLEFEGNAQDSSLYHNHGIEDAVEYVPGIRNQAVSFNGQGAFIKVPDADSLDTDSIMTIAIWISPSQATDPNRNSAIFASKWYTAGSDGDWLLKWSGKKDDSLAFIIANYPEFGIENGVKRVAGGIAPQNSWQYVTAVFDNGHIRTYLNGVLINEETSIIKHTSKNEYDTDSIFLGQSWADNYAYKGLIDDFRIYNRALTESEIQTLYCLTTTANPDQVDNDGDGSGDIFCDNDVDVDGVSDEIDNCQFVANPEQTDTDDDGIGDVCDPLTDSDDDGIADSSDNCPTVANPDQTDTDDDGIGDVCDDEGVCIEPLDIGGMGCYQNKNQTWCTDNEGTWYPGLSCRVDFPTASLSIIINSFSATRNGNGKVRIKLVTGSETETAALQIHRAPSILQNLQQIQEICQWDGVGTNSGSVYSCKDENAPTSVVYWPVEVENDGTMNNYLEFMTIVQ
jgi:hypothetical protein